MSLKMQPAVPRPSLHTALLGWALRGNNPRYDVPPTEPDFPQTPAPATDHTPAEAQAEPHRHDVRGQAR
jgi:hypothetical protein